MRDGLNIAFLGSGRCFHTYDWYRSTLRLLRRKVPYITDNYEGDGLPRMVTDNDDVRELLIIDRFLAAKPSPLGHQWRNLLKLIVAPLQVLLLKRHWRRLGRPFLIAHSTYYAFLASFTGALYSSTPQGSEVLVRRSSRLYRWLLRRSLKRASFITVDSEAMKAEIVRLTDRPVFIVQNGIPVDEVRRGARSGRDLVMSIRAIAENYRIKAIVAGRNASCPDAALTLTFPFTSAPYLEDVRTMLAPGDALLGRVDKEELYGLMARAVCVLSIPESDSSPRSVYEAIFAGAAALCSDSPYIDALPACMRARIVVVDIAQEGWFARGLAEARKIADIDYVPSEEALSAFDQVRSMARCLDLVDRFTAASPALAHANAPA